MHGRTHFSPNTVRLPKSKPIHLFPCLHQLTDYTQSILLNFSFSITCHCHWQLQIQFGSSNHFLLLTCKNGVRIRPQGYNHRRQKDCTNCQIWNHGGSEQTLSEIWKGLVSFAPVKFLQFPSTLLRYYVLYLSDFSIFLVSYGVGFVKIPGLAVVIVGNRKDSLTYVNMKRKACLEVGIKSFEIDLPEQVSEAELISKVHELNANPEVHG